MASQRIRGASPSLCSIIPEGTSWLRVCNKACGAGGSRLKLPHRIAQDG